MARRYCCILAVAAAVDCHDDTNCSAVCRQMYQGLRNFYNATDGLCYAVPVCSQGLVLNQATDQCVSPPELIPSIPPANVTNTQGSEVPDKPIECVHGRLINNSTCVCDAGYSTSISQSASSSSVQMCNIKGTDTSVPDGYVENGDGSLYSTAQVSGASGFWQSIPLLYLLIIVGVGCVVLCVATRCVLAYCKRRQARQLLRPQQSYLPKFKG